MNVKNNRSFQGNQGHNKGGGKGKKERPVCIYCGFTRHIANKCYKLHGYPPRYKPKGGNKPMANQVSGNFGFDANSSVQSNGLPNFGVQSNSMFQNLVNTPLGVQSGFQNAIASSPFGVAQSAFGSSFGGTFLPQSPQSFQTQCPISQAQCGQLLTFLKGYVCAGLGIGTQTNQVAYVLAPNTISTPLQTSTPVTL